MEHFEDRTAVITGGASGIGLATAERLGREGMNLVIADIEEEAGCGLCQSGVPCSSMIPKRPLNTESNC